MTKKFWNDWQKRVGETRNVWYTGCYGTPHQLIGLYDEIVSCKFDGDYVEITVRQHRLVIHNTLHNAFHVENKTFKYHRNEILTVEFKFK